MKKILIWDYLKLSNTGGPSGYLYNIHEYLKKNPSDQIEFLSDYLGFVDEPIDSVGEANTRSSSLVFGFIKLIKDCIWTSFNESFRNVPSNLDLSPFDYIHFHSVAHLTRFKKMFPLYGGKLILTSHCPCPYIDEKLVAYNKIVSKFRTIGLWYECKGYKAADYIMFPCKDAREPYEKDSKIKKIFRSNEDKFIYVHSSIFDVTLDTNKIQKYSEFGIPADSFVITYFGRHNSIKGYDILKQIGANLLPRYDNLYILCAGKGDITPLAHKRWIELGFVNNIPELLYQSDLYVLPNRETYFDLVVLEIMRSSTKIILSETGGNKYFKQFPCDDIYGFDFFDINDIQDLQEKVEKAIIEKRNFPSEYVKYGKSNRDFFLKYFLIDGYVTRYLSTVNSLQ